MRGDIELLAIMASVGSSTGGCLVLLGLLML